MNQTRWILPISQFIPVNITLLKIVAGWSPFFFEKHRFHTLHFPNSTRLVTKPTGRHYTKYRLSPDTVEHHVNSLRGQACTGSNSFLFALPPVLALLSRNKRKPAPIQQWYVDLYVACGIRGMLASYVDRVSGSGSGRLDSQEPLVWHQVCIEEEQ